MVSFRIVVLGDAPDVSKLSSWKSKLFTTAGTIEHFQISRSSDLDDWSYSDKLLSEMVPKRGAEDILLALTNVRLDQNWYTRRINDNRAVMTFHEMQAILRNSNIPPVNLVLRVLYAYSLVYLRCNRSLPLSTVKSYAHDATRGCLFDMTGWKEDIVQSCDRPILCESCCQDLIRELVASEKVELVKDEIAKIQKDHYYRIADWVKAKPVLAIAISSLAAVLLGAMGSIIASWIWSIWYPCPPPS